jgi:uncharacterized membrane protein
LNSVRARRRAVIFGITLAAWILIYSVRAFDGHLALRTNAYDLSVFDYALWSIGHIGLGYVPFMGHSLFSDHFMPTLLALWPVYQLSPSPTLLIALQLAAFAAAAVLLYRLLPDDLPALSTIAILVAFLFGRRSHSAVTSFFYLESFEPLLVFALLLAWRSGRYVIAVVTGVLALGCKEDMAIYLAAFGAVVFFSQSKRQGIGTVAASLLWLFVALVVAVPASRRHDGLPAGSPFVEAAVGSSPAIRRSVERLQAGRAIEVVAMITASTGFLCWLAPAWLTVALPGLLVTLAANPHTPAVSITGHYLFPILPWVFAAAAIGAGRLQRTRPAVLRVVSVLLLLGTIADSPLWRAIGSVSPDERAVAAEIRSSLRRIPADAPVVAMPNLVPHLSHRARIWTLGGPYPQDTATHIVISAVGSLWPFDAEGVRSEIERYQSDHRFTTVMAGPLYVFQRVGQ